ncbi:MAG: FAD-dependent monooxygenase [Archangiaceae bacterium]|nr:FAD-dependent monooxygenase [Archangiaceae bacterium]
MTSDVVVVGGGFAGMACAAALSARGLSVTVLESHLGHDPRFRGELIHPRGVRSLQALGLKDALVAAGGVPVKGFAVSPAAGVDPVLLPYVNHWGEGLGIDHHAMVKALRREVGSRPRVTLRQGQPVTELLEEGGRVVGVKLRDGEAVRARLVVGADGRQSRVRKLLGLEPDITLLSYTVVATVRGPKLPWRGFGHVFLGAPGPILAYPYGDDLIRMCIDVPLSAPRGREPMRAYVREHFATCVPSPLREAMLESVEGDPFEGCATHSVYTKACAVPGAVLVGDAGGCSHPLTATGMTAAMNDVEVLAEELFQGVNDAALKRYQQRRYRFVRARELFTEALYEVFRAHDPGSESLKEGTFEYWRKSRRAREVSMGILSGEDSRPRTFVAEYARVTGLSALATLPDRRRTRSLLSTSLMRLNRTVERSVSTWVQERRTRLASRSSA